MTVSSHRPRQRDVSDRERGIRRELAERAAVLFRLGFSEARAVARLAANIEWDYEVSDRGRPAWLKEKEISTIVATTFARRPS